MNERCHAVYFRLASQGAFHCHTTLHLLQQNLNTTICANQVYLDRCAGILTLWCYLVAAQQLVTHQIPSMKHSTRQLSSSSLPIPYLQARSSLRVVQARVLARAKIVPYPPHSNGKSPVRRRDCTQLCPLYDGIIQADAPCSMLDGDVPRPARGFGYMYAPTVDTPVLIIQANFVREVYCSALQACTMQST